MSYQRLSASFPTVSGQVRSAMYIAFVDEIQRASTEPAQLNQLVSRIYKAALTYAEMDELHQLVNHKRSPNRAGRLIQTVLKREASNIRFLARHEPRSPDRQASRDRRRQLAGGGALPPELRRFYTEAERAVLSVMRQEFKRCGHCALAVDALAARAGCSRSSVHNALRKATLQGHIIVQRRPRPGRKNDTNLIRIISQEWQAWIRLSPVRERVGCNSKILHPTKIEKKEIGSEAMAEWTELELNLVKGRDREKTCG